MSIAVRVRGVYATALTQLLLERDFVIASPSITPGPKSAKGAGASFTTTTAPTARRSDRTPT